jgi:UDP-N-acetyl-D-mannosaminuronic acid dehydrogenase
MAPEDIFNKTKVFMNSVDKNIKDIKIFILGIAFKGNPETSDTRESTTLWFTNHLVSKGVKNLWGYDPIIDNVEIDKLGLKACSLEEGFRDADAVFFMNNHRSYSTLDLEPLISLMKNPSYFYDGWNIFNISDVVCHPGITYSGIGLK